MLCSVFCNGQNYQCLQPGVKHYFTNNNGYLRGISIDSTRVYPDSTIYFPFHTPRGAWGMGLGGAYFPSPDNSGGCWLGKKVIGLPNGTFLFDNLRGDTIVIRSQANMGDTWTFCRDTSATYYTATITGIDTMNVLGHNDSVKRILIRAHNGAGLLRTDIVDSFRIELSKNYGFASVFDLYTFPYHKPDSEYVFGWDYWLDHSLSLPGYFNCSPPDTGNSIFKLTEFIDPMSSVMYDANAGDIFEVAHYYYTLAPTPPSYILDTVTTKTIAGHSTSYYYSGVYMQYNYLTGSYNDLPDTRGAVTYDTVLFWDTTKMPEGVYSDFCNYYFPGDSSYCLHSPLYVEDWIHSSDGRTYKYKVGLGQVDYQFVSGDPVYLEDQLIYYNKSGVACGHIVQTNVAVAQINNRALVVYPDPVGSVLVIEGPDVIRFVEIVDMMGTKWHEGKFQSSTVQINVSHLPPGTYFVRVNGLEVRRFVKE